MILALKTDGATTEIDILTKDGEKIEHVLWESGRTLADGLLEHITLALGRQSKTIQDLTGIIIFRGPGSFTSLRIGITVANTLARSLDLPIVGAIGEDWLATGLVELPKAQIGQIILPLYDREPNITKPKN
jgi:tRNA threonylcarbamoyladenosine biosynthesis protein TsaB